MREIKTTIVMGLLFAMCNTIAYASESKVLWTITGDHTYSTIRKGIELTKPVPAALDESLIDGFKEGDHYIVPTMERNIFVELENSSSKDDLVIWYAKVNGNDSLPRATFFVKEGHFSAWIPTSSGSYYFKNGMLTKEVKRAVSTSDFRVAQPEIGPTPSVIEGARLIKGTARSKTLLPALNSSFEGTIGFRVLFVVTPEFVNAFPDSQVKITEYVTITNESYKASGIEMEMVDAGIMQADIESYTAAQILDALEFKTTDPAFPDGVVKAIRDAALANKADNIEVLTFDLADGLCGLANKGGSANKVFSYIKSSGVTGANTTFENGTVTQACGMLDFAHEVGHTMGLGHSLKQNDPGSVFEYGRGYGVEEKFVTIMAYPQDFNVEGQISKFSSPNLTCFEDLKCGIDSTQSEGADAVFAVNQIKTQYAYIHNEARTLTSSELSNSFSTEVFSCITDRYPQLYTNEQVTRLECNDEITSSNYDGVAKLHKLNLLQLAATNGDLTPLKNMTNLISADFRETEVTNLRRISQLKGQLEFLQFSQTQLSCQDIKVIESWGVEQLSVLGGECQSLGSDSEDFDGDGMNNLNDTDDDNDGIDDVTDASPFDASNAGDIDGDGVADSSDAFPYDESESLDTDADTLGNNADDDDDNDGVADADDCAPLDSTQSTNCSTGGSNSAPTITGMPLTSVNEDVSYTFTPSASDNDNDSLSFSIQNMPTWLNFDGNNGALTGTPGNNDVGLYSNIVISVSDGQESAHLEAFNITVVAVNDAPVISGTPATSVTVGSNYSFTPIATDEEGDELTFSINNTPSWATFDSNTGKLTGAPSEADVGTNTGIIITVSDGDLSSSLESFSIEVKNAGGEGNNDSNVVAFDYDRDGRADIAVRRASNFLQYIKYSGSDDIGRVEFGRGSNDIPVAGDFDGDGIFDVAVRRPSNQFWYVKNSSGTDTISGNSDGITRRAFGLQSTDIPVPADYDGDGKTDLAVRRPSTQFWFILNSSGVDNISNNDDGITRIRFGNQEGDIPVVADYDGDGKADLAVRRPGTQFWYVRNSSGIDSATGNDDGITRLQFGRQEADIPVPADYDGDGKADFAVRRPSNFFWYIRNSSGVDSRSGSEDGISRVQFGRSETDIPVIGDYDGDGKADIAVRRAGNQFWYIQNSSGGNFNSSNEDGIQRINFGLQEQDIPIAAPVLTRMEMSSSD